MPLTNFTGRILRVVVFALLLTSSTVGIFLSEHLWDLWQAGRLPLWAPMAPPLSFFFFMLVFAVDRYHAVQSRRLPPSRAMFQVGASVVFLMLLLPHAGGGLRPFWPRARTPARLPQEIAAPAQLLLGHADDAVRAASCMLIGAQARGKTARGQSDLGEMVANLAANDPALLVRQACTDALARLTHGHGPKLPWPDRSWMPAPRSENPYGRPGSVPMEGDEEDEDEDDGGVCPRDPDQDGCDDNDDGAVAL